jgi:hypothetical protein
MRGFVLRVTAFVATFAFSVGSNSVIDYFYPRYEVLSMASMFIPPDGRGGSTSYRSRSGVYLITEHFDFPSHEAANVAFQNMLRGSRILEREVLYDRDGKLVTGERVVITYRSERGVDAAAVISLDNTKLYEFASTSLRHAVSFERAHRRY